MLRREAHDDAPCIANGRVDQRGNIRDGRWQLAAAAVPLAFNTSYTLTLTMDPRRGGFVAADALLVESHTPYYQGGPASSSVVVGAMDTRILLK